jgi:DNA recombination protein RmuC
MDFMIYAGLLLLGCALGFIICRILIKNRYIPATVHSELTDHMKEAGLRLQLSEKDRHALIQEKQLLSEKLEHKEQLLAEAQSQQAVLRTTLSHWESKLKEQEQALQQKETNLQQCARQISELQQQHSERISQIALKENLLQQQQQRLQELNTSQARLQQQLETVQVQHSRLHAEYKVLQQQLATQKQEIQEQQRVAHLQFEQLANRILEEKSGRFTELNKNNLEALLKPLDEQLQVFRKKVEDTYDRESKERFSLEQKVKELVEQTNRVSTEANNLATALKGQVKQQGNWGEVILESILQHSGLVKDREYTIQATLYDPDGKVLRPDVLVQLPDNRVIIIDSKVSLTAYDRYVAATTPEAQAQHLSEHMKSVYKHIDQLAQKQYDHLEASLDFTMMFMPIEPAYLLSVQSDAGLWSYAYSKRILLISPTNLIACLKLMADLWKRELQSKNAQEIVRRAERMYEKFAGLLHSFDELGKHIDRSQQAYNNAMNQLNRGNGNLVSQAIKLRELGLKSAKNLPASLLPTEAQEAAEAAAEE